MNRLFLNRNPGPVHILDVLQQFLHGGACDMHALYGGSRAVLGCQLLGGQTLGLFLLLSPLLRLGLSRFLGRRLLFGFLLLGLFG